MTLWLVFLTPTQHSSLFSFVNMSSEGKAVNWDDPELEPTRFNFWANRQELRTSVQNLEGQIRRQHEETHKDIQSIRDTNANIEARMLESDALAERRFEALQDLINNMNNQRHHSRSSRSSRTHSSRRRPQPPSHQDSNEDPRHHNVDD